MSQNNSSNSNNNSNNANNDKIDKRRQPYTLLDRNNEPDEEDDDYRVHTELDLLNVNSSGDNNINNNSIGSSSGGDDEDGNVILHNDQEIGQDNNIFPNNNNNKKSWFNRFNELVLKAKRSDFNPLSQTNNSDSNEEEEEEDVDESYYNYYNNNNNNNPNNSNSNSQQQQEQVPLYSIHSPLPWTVRSSIYNIDNNDNNNPTDTISSTTTTTTTNNNNNSYFPFPYYTSRQELNQQQTDFIKNNEIMVIKQPNNSLQVGFSSEKFKNYDKKTGEHDLNAFYQAFNQNDEYVARIANLHAQAQRDIQDGENDNYSTFSDYGYERLYFEVERKKKFLFTLITIEIFYYVLILASFSSLQWVMVFLFGGIANDVLGSYSLSKSNIRLLHIFLFAEVILMIANYILPISGLFIFRFIIFIVGFRLRHELVLLNSINNSRNT
ncbi:hypothetical protein CYY_008682 [Polysphondylium violaceum]|uniref:Transmembrane protein n=1 Tax=Polysphondylium violaceum TaxID=133409 RepID=A0A8J4PMM0_9MYCE|nr:hypothetical protein CYY_008682 [Polysphondylium violaceum]